MRLTVWQLLGLADKSRLPSAPSPNHQSLNIKAALSAGSDRLQNVSESAEFDAQVLLAHILGAERAWLFAHHDELLNQEQMRDWDASLARLEGGEALAYVLGEWEFYGLTFQVTKDVLIPRPETELLVEQAIDWLTARPEKRIAADVGTGSGCIAIALAVNVPDLGIIASDISERALKVAAKNVESHGVSDQVSLVQGEILEEISGPCDLICANLPYIPSGRLGKLAVAQREPLLALDGGEDGLDLIRPFLDQARGKLAPGGLLLAEIDDSHQESSGELGSEFFPGAEISVRKDLAGRTRLLRVAV